jgi:hypothetical protein
MAEEIKEESTDIVNNQDIYSKEETPESEVNENNNSTQPTIQKKVPILNKILYGVVGFLVFILIIGLIMFFMGFFDPEEEVKNKEATKKEILIDDINKFSVKDINSKKLNKQLLMLTNKNREIQEKNEAREKEEEEKKILELEKKKRAESLALEEKKLLDQKKFLESKKLELQREKEELEALKNEAKLLKDELLRSKQSLEAMQTIKKEKIEEVVEVKKVIVQEAPKETVKHEDIFVSLINVAKIKGDLYKSYLDKITNINSNIKLCRDNMNRIEIYIGPFKDNKNRLEVYKKLITNNFKESYEVELTKTEYKKRCDY